MNVSYSDYALLLKALGDETRIKIFHMLSQGELCACNLLEEFNITQPTLSYHMKTLCESGLVNGRKDGIWMKYSINKDALKLLKDLFSDIDEHMKKSDNKLNNIERS
ncbi:metalloregulator ArsR/SmtB family transcription factor [Tissierella praeacuta]|uniref:ArsR/SmtB family transcription factor n=1 Tax=Tissierella praeacuta TaxID=43131 RepID=UPI00334235D8